MSAKKNKSYYNNSFYEKYNISDLTEEEQIKVKALIDKELEEKREKEIEENHEKIFELHQVLYVLSANIPVKDKMKILANLNISNNLVLSFKNKSIDLIKKIEKKEQEKNKKAQLTGILNLRFEQLNINKSIIKVIDDIQKHLSTLLKKNKFDKILDDNKIYEKYTVAKKETILNNTNNKDIKKQTNKKENIKEKNNQENKTIKHNETIKINNKLGKLGVISSNIKDITIQPTKIANKEKTKGENEKKDYLSYLPPLPTKS